MAAATITTDHDDIRLWAEDRGGYPARERGTASQPVVLRIDFPGFSADDTLERISWDEWFQAFDQNRLAFLRQEETEDGQISHFNKLLTQESVERAEPRVRRRANRLEER